MRIVWLKSKLKRNAFKIIILLLLIIPILFFQDFSKHFSAHFTGNIKDVIVTNQWHIVAINIFAFIMFLVPLSYRRKINWKEYGIVTAFFVSLFIEMYGIPLTIYFTSSQFSGVQQSLPSIVYTINFFGVEIAMSLAMIYGLLLMIIGTTIILIGWITLYKNIADQNIVTTGIYKYSRHPQYLGFILVIIGWFIGWPTLLTVLFTPLLILIYIRVSVIEEKELFSFTQYSSYKKETPFLV